MVRSSNPLVAAKELRVDHSAGHEQVRRRETAESTDREEVRGDGVGVRAIVRGRIAARGERNRALDRRADATQASTEVQRGAPAVGVDQEARLVVDHAARRDRESGSGARARRPAGGDHRCATERIDCGGARHHRVGRCADQPPPGSAPLDVLQCPHWGALCKIIAGSTSQQPLMIRCDSLTRPR